MDDLVIELSSSCIVCNAQKSKPCPNKCGQAYYCSEQHQARHWATHRKDCLPYTLRRLFCSRHVDAKRDIRRGQIIFRERPLLVLPYVSPGAPEGLRFGGKFTCPGCCCWSYLAGAVARCYHCQAPLCSMECAQSGIHLGECAAMKSAGFCFTLDNACVTWDDFLLALALFRCCSAIGEVKEKLAVLFNNEAFGHEEWRTYSRQRTVTKLMFGNVLSNEDLKAAVLVRAWHSTDFESRDLLAAPVYFEMSHIAHSCIPNVEIVPLPHKQPFEFAVRARVDIVAGSELFVSRVSGMKPTFIRQVALFRKNIYCRCARCQDRTEMGLYLGSMCCESCQGRGVMSLLVSSVPLCDDAVWVCQTCRAQVESDDVILPLAEIGKLSDTIPHTITDYELFNSKQLFPIGRLHPQHCHVLRINYELACRLYDTHVKTMSPKQLERKLALCRDVLDAMDKYDPGYCMQRGIVQLEVAKTLIRLCHRSAGSGQKVKERRQQANEALEEAVNILKIDSKWADKLSIIRDELTSCHGHDFNNN